ncbi:MAG: hypothetical protein HC836_17400 [Richelia sp. RM2_1_2]|nr:hypothetical protein [Richelia sp. SM1_7_0]NJN06783.1 hypothetical protein [Richelia sp. RM1_1_1]NJO28096.1 hypothetical protein [Richelia sp. SL_2_1]NJO59980.1 hypothetical protein [Richelia sp. RM2_1_2]
MNVTSRANQIQSMIADIDQLLAHKGKRLWGVVSSQEEPREVLQRIRDFLVKEAEEKETLTPAQLPPLVAKFVGEGNQDSVERQKTQSPDHNLSELIQPLKAELTMLLEERANLVSEIRELEKKRLHDYSLAQQLATQEKIISEFMQVLSNRLSDENVVKGSGNITSQKALGASGNQVDSVRVESLTQLTNDLDQRLVALDGTVNVVFEGLQRNIHAYHDSLSQALARMHYKGVQGEQLLEGLIKNFANLPPAQEQELLQQTIEHSSTQAVEADDGNPKNFENVENVDSEQVYTQENHEKLAVIPDETIDNIEFSQAQEDEDDTSMTSDLEAVIFQLEKESVSELNQQLEENDYLEIEWTEEPEEVEEEIIEQEIVVDSEAFDSPEKMQAVLNELKKEQLETEELLANTTSESTNENEVDQLYASLFDSDNLTISNNQTLSRQDLQTTINVANPQNYDLNSQLPETQTEKEVISQEVVFEYTPPSPTVETVDISENEDSIDYGAQLSVPDSSLNENNSGLDNANQSTKNTNTNTLESNQTTSYTYKRKTQAASEDTITQLTELLFEETPSVVTPIPDNSQLNVIQTSKPIQQQELAASSKSETITQTATPEKPQLKEITLPITFQPQPDTKIEANTDLNPLPQTEKTTTLEQQSSPENNPPVISSTEIPSINPSETVWYLGIDLGTTGISAALLNRSTQVIHPIYWDSQQQPQTASQTRNFRLPAEVYLPKSAAHKDTEENPAEQNIYSAYLKPYLQISLPYKNLSETASSEMRQKWEPILQLNEFSTVPLVWIVRSLSKLLLTLKSDSNSTTLGLTATAIGIEKSEFDSIIDNIAGVICTCPSNWSEQYRFNIRESLLISKLVKHPQQVFFVEEAIATLIAKLEGANGEIVKVINNENSPAVATSDTQIIGNTLVINIGANATEMALVDLPENLQDLTHNEFMLHGFTCGGKAMEQDIITQLLLPEKWRKSRNSQSPDNPNDNNPLHWKPNIPGLDKVRFSSLGLNNLELPRPGEPDISQRICLQQRLESSPLGKALLDAAIALKLILQHQESFTIELADQRWELQRRDLESQVFVPFVRRINRELNKLLVARGIPTEAINQIILCGGVSSITAISRWLRQKLPSAKIIQEKYLGENGTPACSSVAIGLCVLPLHPLVLEIPRQQYTDYFLFTELLRLVPEKALSFGEVIQLFEARGINTRTCQQRLLAFLEGEIPPGLIPNSQDMQWLSQTSVQNSNYKAIAASPLFDKQGSLSYRPNLRQLQHLRNYLDTIKASAHQSLEEPYIVNFAVGVSS